MLPVTGVNKNDNNIQVEAQHQARGLHYYHDLDGTVVMTARFSLEQGEVVLKILQVAVDAFDADGSEEEVQGLAASEGMDLSKSKSSIPDLGVAAETSEVPIQPKDSLSQRRPPVRGTCRTGPGHRPSNL